MLFAIIYAVYAIICTLILMLDERKPSAHLSWMFIMILFPIIGLIAFFAWGREKTYTHQQEYVEDAEYDLQAVSSKRIRDLFDSTMFSELMTGEVDLHHQDTFEKLKEDLQNAKDHIHMQYYTWLDDEMTQEVKEILISKADDVDIRILLDGVGSLLLPKEYIRELEDAGMFVHVQYYSKWKFWRINHRDHRKLVVIDGKIGYIGGMNMAIDYVKGGEFSSWKDLHARVRGPIVGKVAALFLERWRFTEGKLLTDDRYFPKSSSGSVTMNLVSTGPHTSFRHILHLYVSLIHDAKTSIIIQTPYFVPCPEMQHALITAALRGVDVRVMVAGTTDSTLTLRASYSKVLPLLEAGVKLFYYENGFLHTKAISIDGSDSAIGSANFDMRSMNLNYEACLYLKDKKIATQLSKIFEGDSSSCTQFTLEDYNNLGKRARLMNYLASVFNSMV